MSKSKEILKAPWKVNTVINDQHVNTFILNSEGARIAEVFSIEDEHADVLAAAPRLLEACEAMEMAIKMTGGVAPQYLTNIIQEAKGVCNDS